MLRHPPSPETTGLPVEEGERAVRLRRIPPQNCQRMNPAKPNAYLLSFKNLDEVSTALVSSKFVRKTSAKAIWRRRVV